MPSPGFFELYPSTRPALPAGAYLLAADQDLVASPPNGADGHLAVDGSDFTFKIISPRFTMPPDQILSTFPPATSVGDWRERLPQIVFKRRTLPWERNPDAVVPFNDSTPPWLALVVLAEGEGTLSEDVPVAECVTSGVTLAGDADTARGKYLDVTETVVQRIFPTIEDLNLLCHVRHVDLADTELALGDDDGYLAVVLANRLPQPGPPAEGTTTPTSKKYTAYLINLEGQLPILPTKEQSESVLDFVVHMPELVNRQFALAPQEFGFGTDISVDTIVMQPHHFAAKPLSARAAEQPNGPLAGPTVAAAKGIEHAAAAYATGPTKTSAAQSNDTHQAAQWVLGTSMTELAGLADLLSVFPLERRFRFPVLVSWDFVCTGDGGFERLMNALDPGMLGTEDGHGDAALRPDISVTGHISLAHRTRRGEATESWYRGPLVPQPTNRVVPNPDGSLPIAHTGDQLRRVVPDGHEDVGLAAAFEIGRLLALSKPGIVSALIEWRNDLFGASRARVISDELIEKLVSGISGAVLAGSRTLDELLTTNLFVPYAEKLPDIVGPRARSFATARVPDEITKLRPADLLAGLGLDATAVRAATEKFGAAGLATIAVSMGETPSAPVSKSSDDLAALQAVLNGHLDQLATEALKLGDTKPGDTKLGATRPRKDELDRFIERATSSREE